MNSNHQLTGVLQGRAVTAVNQNGATLLLTMSDGSVMHVQTGDGSAAPPAALPASPIAKVRQQGTQLALDTTDGQTLQLTLAEVTSSVMVRDKSGVMEYAD